MSEEEQQLEPLEEKVERHRHAILQIVEAWEEDHQKLKDLVERVKRMEGCMVRMIAWKASMKKLGNKVTPTGNRLNQLENMRLVEIETQLRRLETIVMGVRPPSDEEEEEEDPPSQ